MARPSLLHRCGLPQGLLVLLALGGCGEPEVYGTLDAELRQALREAGVYEILPPPPEDPAMVALGQALFFDKELSGNRNISCATCHHPVAGTGDGLPLSIGEGGAGLAEARHMAAGAMIPRNAPPIFNAGLAELTSMFWDSRLRWDPTTRRLQSPEPGLNGASPALADHVVPLDGALAAQAMFPVTSLEEMRGQPGSNALADAADNAAVWAALMQRLGAIPAYRDLFANAFPAAASFEALTFGHAARAIAAFERQSWTALGTPFDRYLLGDDSALSDAQARGAMLFFGKARCSACHNGPLLSDLEHHAVCVPQLGPGKLEPSEDRGLALVSGDAADNYRFRTPPLRNVALTGPWMHDGAFTELENVVLHHLKPTASFEEYDAGQLPPVFRVTLDDDSGRNQARMAALEEAYRAPVDLSAHELADLMRFLRVGLTDPDSWSPFLNVPDTVPSGLEVWD